MLRVQIHKRTATHIEVTLRDGDDVIVDRRAFEAKTNAQLRAQLRERVRTRRASGRNLPDVAAIDVPLQGPSVAPQGRARIHVVHHGSATLVLSCVAPRSRVVHQWMHPEEPCWWMVAKGRPRINGVRVKAPAPIFAPLSQCTIQTGDAPAFVVAIMNPGAAARLLGGAEGEALAATPIAGAARTNLMLRQVEPVTSAWSLPSLREAATRALADVQAMLGRRLTEGEMPSEMRESIPDDGVTRTVELADPPTQHRAFWVDADTGASLSERMAHRPDWLSVLVSGRRVSWTADGAPAYAAVEGPIVTFTHPGRTTNAVTLSPLTLLCLTARPEGVALGGERVKLRKRRTLDRQTLQWVDPLDTEPIAIEE